MPAHAMPIQISVVRQTATMNTSSLGPPVAPSTSAAMMIAV
jgi:hypothetical protein